MTSTTHDLAPVPNENVSAEGMILKTDCKGRIRFPAHMRERLLDEYERSGMSGAEFAEFYNLKYPTFATWRQRRERERKKAHREQEGCRLIEVAVEDASETSGVQIDLPGGASVRIRNASEAGLVAEVLKGLSRC